MTGESLISVAEAEALIRECMPRWPEQSTPVAACGGQVLRQPVMADREQPPFDRVTMDGIALRAAALTARRTFTIQATQAAGDPPLRLDHESYCIEIMTGAVLPEGCDQVVPVEQIEVAEGAARIEDGVGPEPYRWVHRRGSDFAAGAALMEPGQRLGAAEAAVLASVGLPDVLVGLWPRVSVTSTGDELVAPGRAIAPHQVRCSNDYAILAALRQLGVTECSQASIADDEDALRDHLGAALDQHDMLIISGGVSKGRFDYLPAVLDDLGVRCIFHRVSQRPGKPMWFGMAAGDKPVFALPGNPVSALVCLRRYVLPATLEAMGARMGTRRTIPLAAAPQALQELTRFVPVRLEPDQSGATRAQAVDMNTSGDFFSLAGSDGLIEVPPQGAEQAAYGEAVFMPWSLS